MFLINKNDLDVKCLNEFVSKFIQKKSAAIRMDYVS